MSTGRFAINGGSLTENNDRTCAQCFNLGDNPSCVGRCGSTTATDTEGDFSNSFSDGDFDNNNFTNDFGADITNNLGTRRRTRRRTKRRRGERSTRSGRPTRSTNTSRNRTTDFASVLSTRPSCNDICNADRSNSSNRKVNINGNMGNFTEPPTTNPIDLRRLCGFNTTACGQQNRTNSRNGNVLNNTLNGKTISGGIDNNGNNCNLCGTGTISGHPDPNFCYACDPCNKTKVCPEVEPPRRPKTYEEKKDDRGIRCPVEEDPMDPPRPPTYEEKKYMMGLCKCSKKMDCCDEIFEFDCKDLQKHSVTKTVKCVFDDPKMELECEMVTYTVKVYPDIEDCKVVGFKYDLEADCMGDCTFSEGKDLIAKSVVAKTCKEAFELTRCELKKECFTLPEDCDCYALLHEIKSIEFCVLLVDSGDRHKYNYGAGSSRKKKGDCGSCYTTDTSMYSTGSLRIDKHSSYTNNSIESTGSSTKNTASSRSTVGTGSIRSTRSTNTSSTSMNNTRNTRSASSRSASSRSASTGGCSSCKGH